MATDKQVAYIERLCIEAGFRSLKERNLYLSDRAGRDVKHPSDLDVKEASAVIEALLETKDSQWEQEARNKGYDPNDDYRK